MIKDYTITFIILLIISFFIVPFWAIVSLVIMAGICYLMLREEKYNEL